MSEDMPTEKRCTKCGEIKLLDAFTRHKRGKDGFSEQCRICTRQRNNTYGASHKEEKRAYDAAYRLAHRDKKIEYDRIYRATHIDEIRAYKQATIEEGRRYARLYYAARAAEICQEKRDQRAADPETKREYARRHRQANPDVYLNAVHKRRAYKKSNGGIFTTQELKAMRKAQNGICAYCKGRYDKLSIDHVLPITQGGRHEAANIVLACQSCNSSKNNRTPEQWTNRWYERKRRDDDQQSNE